MANCFDCGMEMFIFALIQNEFIWHLSSPVSINRNTFIHSTSKLDLARLKIQKFFSIAASAFSYCSSGKGYQKY